MHKFGWILPITISGIVYSKTVSGIVPETVYAFGRGQTSIHLAGHAELHEV